jgi:hypothetical protein
MASSSQESPKDENIVALFITALEHMNRITEYVRSSERFPPHKLVVLLTVASSAKKENQIQPIKSQRTSMRWSFTSRKQPSELEHMN